MLKGEPVLRNQLKQARIAMYLPQTQLVEPIGVSRNATSSIGTEQLNPTAKPVLILCIALE